MLSPSRVDLDYGPMEVDGTPIMKPDNEDLIVISDDEDTPMDDDPTTPIENPTTPYEDPTALETITQDSPLQSLNFTNYTVHNITRTFVSHACDYTAIDFQFTSNQDFFPDQFLVYFDYMYHDTVYILDILDVKVSFSLSVNFIQVDNNGVVYNRTPIVFSIPMTPLCNVSYDAICSRFTSDIENCVSLASNLMVEFVNYLDMNVVLYNSIERCARSNSVLLPEKLRNKKAVVNVNNTGNDCFRYALLSVLHYNDVERDRQRPSKYTQWLQEHNWTGITFPMTAGQLPLFERNNPGLVINLLEWKDEDSTVHRIRTAPIPKSTEQDVRCVNIMAVQVEEDKWHYVGVTNLDRLLCEKNKLSGYTYCERCFRCLRYNIKDGKGKQQVVDEHRHGCYADKPDSVKMPESFSLQFENWKAIDRLPYVVYADAECYLERDSDVITKHIPVSIGCLLVPRSDMKHTPLEKSYTVFTGPDCMLQFCHHIHQLSREVYEWNKKYTRVPLNVTAYELRQRDSATACYICSEVFMSEEEKVMEHDHINGKLRGISCKPCNSKMKLRRNMLPVFFHNGRGYDNHLLCQYALGEMKQWKVEPIPQTKENYISMTASYDIDKYFNKKKQKEISIRMKIQFKDSAQFLHSSLSELVGNLEMSDLIHTKSAFPSEAQSHLEFYGESNKVHSLINAKGVFPYEWFDTVQKLESRSLPSQESFRDRLNIAECSDIEYMHAQKAWEVFGCNTFCDYMLSYLKLDVHQLADVFEKFRDLALHEDGLDPAHYFTLPGFTLDSALKMCKTELNLLDTVEKYEYVESGIRGGCTFVNKHHIMINSEELYPDEYNPSSAQREMMYVDANNLYGHALTEPLPIGEGTWMEEYAEFQDKDWILTQDFVNCDYAYLVDVDLIYPPKLHDETCSLPLAPEKMVIPTTYHSEFMKKLVESEYGEGKQRRPTTKLLLTQFDKPNYVVHARLLQFYVKMGMKIERVNRVLRFRQSRVFKKYIEYNSMKRMQASNDFEKDFYKLKNNALYGKTVENKRRRMRFCLASTPEEVMKYSSNPSFNDCIIFNEHLVGCHLLRERIILDKPIFIGQTVLDIAKLIMYELYYVKLKKYETEFNCKIDVVGGDTDSFFLVVDNCSVYDQLVPAMLRDDLLDTSNFDKSHKYYSEKNRARLGCIKDESKGEPYREWVLLKPKCYSMETIARKVAKRAKGVKRATVKKKITHKDYYQAYKEKKHIYHTQMRIGSKKHNLTTTTFTKKSLSSFEDKRCWLKSNFSLPYGHYTLDRQRPSIRKSVDTIPVVINFD